MIIKSGFVAIIGCSNVGKSTLLNTILNKKISIVTAKTQTTRNQIQGIYNDEETQIIFMDTPGVHKSYNEMEKFMNKIVLSTIKSANIILFLVQSNKKICKNDYFIFKLLKEQKIPIILIITKIELISKNYLIVKISELKKIYNFIAIVPVSSKKYININKILILLKNFLKEGTRYFPVNVLTNQTKKFLISEIIREKILLLINKEIPYSVFVLVDKIEDKFFLLKITTSICVEKNSQKKIVIGEHGKLIKKIGINSRIELEKILETKIFLELFVKVIKKWRYKQSIITKLWHNKEIY